MKSLRELDLVPTEDQRDEWHNIDLAKVMTRLDDYLRVVGRELSGYEIEHLLDELPSIVTAAYSAGRLNPLPIKAWERGVVTPE